MAEISIAVIVLSPFSIENSISERQRAGVVGLHPARWPECNAEAVCLAL